MQLEKLLRGIEILDGNYDGSTEITGICCDSRQAGPGVIYVAARRITADGHVYIPAAVEAGASLIVAQEPVEGAAYIRVADATAALGALCANFHGNPAEHMQIIGITGTKGKSTTAYNVKHILTRALGAKVGLIGTVVNMAGDEILSESKNSTPEAPTLHALFAQMYARGCTHVVMEVSSHALDVDRVSGVRYASAVFTNLSQDHLDYHITMENYLRAKAKIFSIADCGVVNVDDAAGASLLDTMPVAAHTFAVDRTDTEFSVENLNFTGSTGVDFTAVYQGEKRPVRLQTSGKFMAYNALAAIACAVSVGVDFRAACEAMCCAPSVPGRLEPVDEGQDFRVIVDYAHSPESVRQICKTAREFTKGRLICLLGCGGNRDRTKRPIMGAAAAEYGDFVIVTTDNPRFEEPEDIIHEILPGVENTGREHIAITDRREAIRYAIDLAQSGDTVLLMGKGHETYQEVRGVRSYFSDADEARIALKGKKSC